jgi:acetyl esterase
VSAFVLDRFTEVTDAYLGEAGLAAASDHALADPLLLLEDDPVLARPLPPVFLSVGTRDPLEDDTRRLHRALGALRAPCEVCYYDGERHAFHALVWRPNARRCWRDTYAFLDRALERPPSSA